MEIVERIAQELSVRVQQVQAAVNLLEDATVPFVARYRKEATGGLDDTQLRRLEERLNYLRQLEERREVILNSIRDQDKLTDELEQSIRQAETQVRLEDLYLPYRPKRRTKAQIAREAGLEPLALSLWKNPELSPDTEAVQYIAADQGIEDSKQALDGARQILMEVFSEDAELVGELREFLWNKSLWKSSVVKGKEEEGRKFSDYFDYSEPIRLIPSHRILALLRGRREGILRLSLLPDAEHGPGDGAGLSRPELRLAQRSEIEDLGRPADGWLLDTVRWTWKVKVLTRLETDLENQ
ncbi:MAG: RNA-binding transcriptional accessory protein, partial [Acidobacteriota bacterium]